MEQVINKIKSVDYDNATQDVVSDIVIDILKLNDEEIVDVMLFIIDDLPVSIIIRDYNSKESFYSNIFNDKRLLGFKKDLEKRIEM